LKTVYKNVYYSKLVEERESKVAVVAARIPLRLRLLIRHYVELDEHVSESDFIRDAIRHEFERIANEKPDLYKRLLKRVE